MLKFNEEKHEYTLGNRTLISVTQLMRKHGLAPDYSNVDETVLRAKAERGTLIHKEIEDYIKTGEIGWSNEVLSFMDYVKDNKVNILSSELMVNNDIVAGTIDLILDDKGQPVIADIKTTYQVHKESVSWQLSIYLFLYVVDKGINYNEFEGQCYHFDKEGQLEVLDIPLKPFTEVASLMQCEREGKTYKQELKVENDTLLQLEDVENIIKYHEEQLKQAKAKEEEMRNALMQAMEENSIKTYETDKLKITYVEATTRSTVDSVRLKKEMPDIADKYTKVSNVKATLKITLKGN